MNGSRQFLVFVVAIFVGFGLVVVAIPFVLSLAPSDRAEASRQAWTMPPPPELLPGEVLHREVSQSERRNLPSGGWAARWGKRDLVIRDYDGAYYWYRLPTWEGGILMPGRIAWGQWEGVCKDFGPMMKGSKLVQGTSIQCNDPEFGNFPARDVSWSIDGKSQNEPFPDLPRWLCAKLKGEDLVCHES